MGSYLGLFTVYLLGGLTFPTLVILVIFLHAYLTLPIRHVVSFASTESQDALDESKSDEGLLDPRATDVKEAIKDQATETDAAAGYFAVCREYVPGGVNGKPPERTTPAGTVIAAESPTVYQSMYRSIFDRRLNPSIDPGKGGKRGRNVFYVALRCLAKIFQL